MTLDGGNAKLTIKILITGPGAGRNPSGFRNSV